MIFTINRVIVYKINMLGYISLLLFSHAMVSTLRWRTFVQVNQEPFFLPVDVSRKSSQIALEIALATVIALIAILALTRKFKVLRRF